MTFGINRTRMRFFSEEKDNFKLGIFFHNAGCTGGYI